LKSLYSIPALHPGKVFESGNLLALYLEVFMQVSLNHTEQNSAEQTADLEKIRKIVQRALADGFLSRSERDTLMNAVYRDQKVSLEECALLRSVQEKIWAGEVQIGD
jgi:hypothetical protein